MLSSFATKVWKKIFGYQLGDQVEFYNMQTDNWEKGKITRIFKEFTPPRYWVQEKVSGVVYAVFETEIR